MCLLCSLDIHYLLCEALRTLCALRGKLFKTAEGAKVTQFRKGNVQYNHIMLFRNNHVMLFRILSDDPCVFVASVKELTKAQRKIFLAIIP